MLTPRLSYGLAGAWLGVSLRDALARATAATSGQRDRASRGSAALGFGYMLTPRTVLTFDVAGGVAHTGTVRTENATGNLLQTDAAGHQFVSWHAAVQREMGRHLFASASLLSIWRSNSVAGILYPDVLGNSVAVEDSTFQLSPGTYRTGNRFSDFSVGWRFSQNLFAQYLYSTSYGASGGCHTLMLRYRLSLRGE